MISLPPLIVNDYHCVYSIDRGDVPISFIVAHGTRGKDSRGYIQRGGDLGNIRGISIHCLIQKFPRANGSTDLVMGKPGTLHIGAAIYRMLDDSRGANHAGYCRVNMGSRTFSGIDVNRASLSFELENLQDRRDPYTEDQLLCMGWLINHWRDLYGDLIVYRHEDIDTRRPKERFDPVGLSVNEIEDWCLRAKAVTSDRWLLWGDKYPLNKGWSIPQAWYKKAVMLGACTSDETYVNDVSIQTFERGFCVYYKVSNRAEAFLYTEL